MLGGDEAAIAALCDETRADGEVLAPANFNAPGQIVISGSRSACARAVELAAARGLRAVMLKVSGAFHSPLMASAAGALREVLEATPFAAPSCRVVANVDARPHEPAALAMRDRLARQVTDPVRWQASVEYLIAEGVDTFVEIGPGRVLTGLMRKIDRRVRALNVSSAADLNMESLEQAAQA